MAEGGGGGGPGRAARHQITAAAPAAAAIIYNKNTTHAAPSLPPKLAGPQPAGFVQPPAAQPRAPWRLCPRGSALASSFVPLPRAGSFPAFYFFIYFLFFFSLPAPPLHVDSARAARPPSGALSTPPAEPCAGKVGAAPPRGAAPAPHGASRRPPAALTGGERSAPPPPLTPPARPVPLSRGQRALCARSHSNRAVTFRRERGGVG